MGDNSTRIRVIGEDVFSGTLQDAQRAVQGLANEAGKATGSIGEGASLAGSFVMGLGLGAGKFALDAAVSLFRELGEAIREIPEAMVDANREWETFSNQFYVLLDRDWGKVEDRMSELEDFAISTPFELDEVIEADRLMQLFGLHADDVATRWGIAGDDIRTVIGDTASGTKASYDELARWVGRFASGDTGRALNRFEQLGVTTRDELEKMGLEFEKSGELISPLDESMTVLLRLMGTKFGGLMQIQAESLSGMESNLRDWTKRQARLWGEPIFDAYKEQAAGLWQFLQSDGVEGMMEAGRGLLAAGTGWLVDLVSEYTTGFQAMWPSILERGTRLAEALTQGFEDGNPGEVIGGLFMAQLTRWGVDSYQGLVNTGATWATNLLKGFEGGLSAGLLESLKRAFAGLTWANIWEAIRSNIKWEAPTAENMGAFEWTAPEAGKGGLLEQILKWWMLGSGAPGFASGTSYAPGGWAVVGERGPELVNLPRGSQVTPANETRQALSGATVHVHPGAIVLNIANGNAREVQRGVVGALRQIGMPA
jgi:hypothetical protein